MIALLISWVACVFSSFLSSGARDKTLILLVLFTNKYFFFFIFVHSCNYTYDSIFSIFYFQYDLRFNSLFNISNIKLYYQYLKVIYIQQYNKRKVYFILLLFITVCLFCLLDYLYTLFNLTKFRRSNM